MRKDKRAKLSSAPSAQKKPKFSSAIPHDGQGRVFFSFELFDDGSKWCDGDHRAIASDIWDVGSKLRSFQQREWKHISANTKRDHPVETWRIIREAQQVLERRRYDDFDLWSFHINGRQRIWGIKDGDMFMVLWWDPHHKICPSLRN